MLPATLGSHATPAFVDALLLVAVASLLNALARVTLCMLAAYTVIKALQESGVGKDQEAARHHYQAILALLIEPLTRRKDASGSWTCRRPAVDPPAPGAAPGLRSNIPITSAPAE